MMPKPFPCQGKIEGIQPPEGCRASAFGIGAQETGFLTDPGGHRCQNHAAVGANSCTSEGKTRFLTDKCAHPMKADGRR